MLTMREKKSLTGELIRRYQKSKRVEKTRILDEFVSTTGYNRSYARRVLRAAQSRDLRRKKKIHRKGVRQYDDEVLSYLRRYWIIANFICGKRFHPLLPEYIRTLERDGILVPSLAVKTKLLTISPATIDRVLKPSRVKLKLKGKTTTKPGTLLKHQIPVRTFADWNENRPGFFETDLVAFCGDTLCGTFCWGLNLTDVFTGWVHLGVVWGKSATAVQAEIDAIRSRMFFKLLGLDSDNGSEFINVILLWYTRDNQITFTRNRANKKNDNCYVEQKNYTTLRVFVGYQRLDKPAHLNILEELLPMVELYVNFFQASTKLTHKERDGAKMKKQHDRGLTPYQRLCRSGILTKQQRKALSRIYNSHNPLELKQKIEALQHKLWSFHETPIVTNYVESTNRSSVTF